MLGSCLHADPGSGSNSSSGGGGDAAGNSGRCGSVTAAVAAQALLCLAAWVRLGLLHEIEREVRGQLMQATLAALQSASEQVRAFVCCFRFGRLLAVVVS